MRLVKTIDDVNAALREVQDFMDSMRVRNIDLHQRKVVNAAPSSDDYDYVIRKELYDLKLSIDKLNSTMSQKFTEIDIKMQKISAQLKTLGQAGL